MYTHTRTTFARYRYIPVRTSATEFLNLYLRYVADRPMFRTQDLARRVPAIDLRRFDLDMLEAAFAGHRLSPNFAALEADLAGILSRLLDEFGDPAL
jgi:hypothetical protein